MFTGLIECTGTIKRLERKSKSIALAVDPSKRDFETQIGASIAIDGVCLTVEHIQGNILYFTAVFETLSRTTLAHAKPGTIVNLERALPASGRLDGHLVLGHIDGVGEIGADQTVGDSIIRSIRVPRDLMRFMAIKGSVAIDGISLTIANAESSDNTISLSLVPHTLDETSLSRKNAGDKVNIECDVLAKYIEQLLTNNTSNASTGPSRANADSRNLRALMEKSGF